MTHIHRWRIDEPQGPTSHAICSGCGSERDYRNAADWERAGNWRDLEAAHAGFALGPRTRTEVVG